MAYAGLVIGWLVVGAVLSALGPGPWSLLAGPVIVGIAALFYWKVGPRWAAAADEFDEAHGGAVAGAEPEPPRASPSRTAMVIVYGTAAALVGSLGIGIALDWLGVQVQEQQTVLTIVQGSDGSITLEAILLAVSALLLAPIAEEGLFRGLLFRRVRARSSRGLAYVLSAFGFAAIHGNPAGFVIYLWLGLVFAAAYERTGWLGAAMAVHLGNNAYVLAMLFGFGGG